MFISLALVWGEAGEGRVMDAVAGGSLAVTTLTVTRTLRIFLVFMAAQMGTPSLKAPVQQILAPRLAES